MEHSFQSRRISGSQADTKCGVKLPVNCCIVFRFLHLDCFFFNFRHNNENVTSCYRDTANTSEPWTRYVIHVYV